MCESGLKEQVSTSNVAEIYKFSFLHQLEDLQGKCLELIAKHFDEVEETAGWQDVQDDPAMLRVVLKFVCSSKI